MMGRTHAMGGVASLWLLSVVPGAITNAADNRNVGVLALCAVVGALFPDLDAGKSLLSTFAFTKKGPAPFALPAQVLHDSLGHRGALHSLVGCAAATLIMGVALVARLGWTAAAAFTLGFLSHLLLDCLTPTGLPLLWPQKRKVWLLPKRLRIVTGSPMEEGIFVLMALPAAVLLLALIPR